MFLNSKNSTNMSIDPTNQSVFSQTITPYFGLTHSILCATGLSKYNNSELVITSTANGELFGNSLYLGYNTINSQYFYMLVILPEALFNGNPVNLTNNIISIYSTVNTLFYLNVNSNSSTEFSPSSTKIQSASSTTTTNNNTLPSTTFNLSKLTMSVSNINIIS